MRIQFTENVRNSNSESSCIEGRNPYAWLSILTPVSKLIEDERKALKAFTTDIQLAMKPEPAETKPSNENLIPGVLFTSTPKDSLHYPNQGAGSTFRDLVSP